jgi:molybdate transport system substrate-binding protein
VVSHEENVKAVAAKIQLGEADAGIVFVTDVTPSLANDVRTIPIPDPFNPIASYPIALVKGGNAQLGQAFIDYVLSDAGQAALRSAGFLSP